MRIAFGPPATSCSRSSLVVTKMFLSSAGIASIFICCESTEVHFTVQDPRLRNCCYKLGSPLSSERISPIRRRTRSCGWPLTKPADQVRDQFSLGRKDFHHHQHQHHDCNGAPAELSQSTRVSTIVTISNSFKFIVNSSANAFTETSRSEASCEKVFWLAASHGCQTLPSLRKITSSRLKRTKRNSAFALVRDLVSFFTGPRDCLSRRLTIITTPTFSRSVAVHKPEFV